MQIVPFESWHLGLIELREHDQRAVAFGDDLVARGNAYLRSGPAYTGLHEGRVVVVAGIVKLWMGVGGGWSLTSPLVEKFPVSFHRAVWRNILKSEENLCLHRLQITVQASHIVSQSWVERLGFQFEGVLKKYGPDGEDYLLFARVH
jgi:hypothetical protein